MTLYSEADYAAILAALPEPLRTDRVALEALEHGIQVTGYRYLLEKRMEQDVQKDAQTRAELAAASRAAKALVEACDSMNGWFLWYVFDGGEDEPFPVTREQIAKLHQAATDKLAELEESKRSGRRRSPSVQRYIAAVILLWESFTERTAGYTQLPYDLPVKERGPFLDFAEAVARPVLGSRFTRSLFVEAIKRRRREEKPPD